jgi:hypothetical protein
MPLLNATVTIGLQYTPPGGVQNSATVSFPITASCAAQNVGQIDVNSTVSALDEIEIPFGSVSDAKIIVVKNLGANEYGIKISGSSVFRLPPGGEWMYGGTAAPSAETVSSCTVVVIDVPTSTEYLQYFVFGD